MSNVIVEPGDRVIDPLDGEIREVSYIFLEDVYMTDGGVMGLSEITHENLFLPGEVIPSETD
jgi:hypothetical protein